MDLPLRARLCRGILSRAALKEYPACICTWLAGGPYVIGTFYSSKSEEGNFGFYIVALSFSVATYFKILAASMLWLHLSAQKTFFTVAKYRYCVKYDAHRDGSQNGYESTT